MKFYIIAGHGGINANGVQDVGAVNKHGVTELSKTEEMQALITKNMSDELVMQEPDMEALWKTVNSINATSAADDHALDIHFNAAGDARATGTECFVFEGTSDKNRKLAQRLSVITAETLGIPNRGVKNEGASQHSRLAMVSGIRPASILLEVCFITNERDMAQYEAHKEVLAQKIAQALKLYGGNTKT
jgi:N-acetylmuramoyl-L-alanine amidase